MKNTPKSVVVDTGPIVALFDADDPHHAESTDYFQSTQGTLITTLASVTEAMHLLDFSIVGQSNLLTWIQRGGLTLEHPTSDDLDRVETLMKKYADRPMNFADGLLVAICKRLDVAHVATLDSDFDTYRINGRKRFVNVLR